MKSIHYRVTPFLTLILCIVALSGCLNDNGTKISSRVRFGMQVDGFDTTITSGSDSINVERIRFVYGDGSVVINNDTTSILPEETSWSQYGITQTSGNPIPLFQSSYGVYQSFVLSVQKAPVDNANIDPDFTEETRHSMIIDGKYNGAEFTYNMDRAFKSTLDIMPDADVPQYNESFVFLISSDVRSWFANNDGGFYNPNNADDSTGINDNIENSFFIETVQQ